MQPLKIIYFLGLLGNVGIMVDLFNSIKNQYKIMPRKEKPKVRIRFFTLKSQKKNEKLNLNIKKEMINRNMLNNKENSKTKSQTVQNFDKIDSPPLKMTKGKKEEMKQNGNLSRTDQMLKADGKFKVKY